MSKCNYTRDLDWEQLFSLSETNRESRPITKKMDTLSFIAFFNFKFYVKSEKLTMVPTEIQAKSIEY